MVPDATYEGGPTHEGHATRRVPDLSERRDSLLRRLAGDSGQLSCRLVREHNTGDDFVSQVRTVSIASYSHLDDDNDNWLL